MRSLARLVAFIWNFMLLFAFIILVMRGGEVNYAAAAFAIIGTLVTIALLP